MGLLTHVCETCGHRHGRLTERCMQPRCRCLGRRADRIRRRLYGEGKWPQA